MGRHEFRVDVDDGMWLHCVDVGDADAPLVLVSSACFLSADFDPLADQYRLVFVDGRGRGGSTPVTSAHQTSPDASVDDLDRVRRHLGAEVVHLIGWSVGGGQVCAYAMDYPQHTGRVLTIGWVPPRHAPPTPADRDEFEQRARARVPTDQLARLERLRADGLDESDPVAFSREAFYANAAYQTPRPEALRAMRSEPWRYENERGDRWRKVFEWSTSGARRERSGVLDAPTLVVFGDGDRGPLRDARDWVWDHRATRLLVLPGVGHYPWLEDPDRFFPAALQFFAGDWPASAEVIVQQPPA